MTRHDFQKQIEDVLRANRRGEALPPAATAAVSATIAAIDSGEVMSLADEVLFIAAVRATMLVRDQIHAALKGAPDV